MPGQKISLGLMLNIALGCLMGMTGQASAQERVIPWVVHYVNSAPLSAYDPYTLIVVDSNAHPEISQLKRAGNKTVLGYLSIGEIAQYRSYFGMARHRGLLLRENANWPGSWMVDFRNEKWKALVLDRIVPEILASGFDGIFLDTVDNAEYLESLDPVANAGMKQAAADLIRNLKRRFPQAKIMLNRGYAVLPQLGSHIDYLLAESVYASYDFKQGHYFIVEQQQYAEHMKILTSARKSFPSLQIMTLDYWDPNDIEGMTKIYEKQELNGFSPFVAPINLDQIITPKR